MKGNDGAGRDAPRRRIDPDSRAVWVRLISESQADLRTVRQHCLFTHGRMLRDDELLVYALRYTVNALLDDTPYDVPEEGGPPW